MGRPQACGPETGVLEAAAQPRPAPLAPRVCPPQAPAPRWGGSALQDLKLLVLCSGKQVGDTEMKQRMTAGWASRDSAPQGGHRVRTPLSAPPRSAAELRGQMGGCGCVPAPPDTCVGQGCYAPL